MRELDAILSAWTDESSILATVVDVIGSAYRKSGARMLITRDGRRIGSISGGCLESDIVKKAWWWTESGPVVRTYDGIGGSQEFGLGCNGIVRILVERTSAELRDFLEVCRVQRRSGVVATVLGQGARLFLYPNGRLHGDPLHHALIGEMEDARIERQSRLVVHDGAEVFIEVIPPPLPLLVFGAGDDAMPVVRFAKQLGWHVTVVDGRPAYAKQQRFPQADQITNSPEIDPNCAAIVMNHNYRRDRSVLETLLQSNLQYIGLLGPRYRSEQMLNELGLSDWPENLHAPAGLDIGANTPETIALSIVAQIQAVIAGRKGLALSNRKWENSCNTMMPISA
jgi:xanthine dehydrogenase accessory factor